jgi:hypothetical protein
MQFRTSFYVETRNYNKFLDNVSANLSTYPFYKFTLIYLPSDKFIALI